MQARISLLGLYNWDNTLFDGWTLPEAIDAEILRGLLIQECGELETTLPEPDLFKAVTGLWTRRKGRAWARALAAMTASYNPIHNYDRNETYTDTESGSGGSDTSASNTRTDKTAAFNSSTYENKGQSTESGTGESSSTYGRTLSHTARMSGNIGVTTSQQMVNDELDLSDRLDPYWIIVRDFKKEFCVQVY